MRMSPFGSKPQSQGQPGQQPQGDPFEVGGGGGQQNPFGSKPQGQGQGQGQSALPQTPQAQAPVLNSGFAQRRANAQSLYGPGGSGWAQNFAPTPFSPQKQEQGGGAGVGQAPTRPPMFRPPPVFQAQPGGSAPFNPSGNSGVFGQRPQPGGPGQFGPPQLADSAPPQAALLQQLFSQPGFMQMLQQYMSRQQKPQMPGGGSGPYNPQQF